MKPKTVEITLKSPNLKKAIKVLVLEMRTSVVEFRPFKARLLTIEYRIFNQSGRYLRETEWIFSFNVEVEE